MKKQEAYDFYFDEEKTKFRFVSEGPLGAIPKIVEYSRYRTFWNLAFGDAKPGEDDFDDTSITNNGDMRKVIQTVVNTAYMFTDAHPERKTYIEPVDRKRRLVYNRILQEKTEDIEAAFKVQGLDFGSGSLENYNPEKTYDAFVITRIPVNFEK